MMEKGDPAFAALQLPFARDKKSTLLLAVDDVGDDSLFFARGDHQRDAGSSGHFCCANFCLHPANSRCAQRPSGEFLDVGIYFFNDRNCIRIFLTEIFNQAINGCEDDQQVCR